MPAIIETTVYQFNELSERAKDNARQWFRDVSANDDWYDSTFEDVKECGKLIGITIDKIYFRGFWSQGDGACFEGSYSYAKAAPATIAAYTGGNETLVRIAKELLEVQRKAFYRLTATVKHSGRYYHEYCTDIDVYNNGEIADNVTDEIISTLLRDFMRWIYRELEKAYNDYMSNETVDDNIRCNEYTFDINGKRF